MAFPLKPSRERKTMKIRKSFRLLRPASAFRYLLLIYVVLIFGCAYAPDIKNPGAPPWVDFWAFRLHVAELDMPQIRTVYVDTDKEIIFEMEKYGRRLWWEGFYNATAQWRFVLLSPEGKMIPCAGSNTWEDMDTGKVSDDHPIFKCEVTVLKDYLNMPLSADLDFRLRGEESKDENAPYRSVGRMVYVMKGYEYKYP